MPEMLADAKKWIVERGKPVIVRTQDTEELILVPQTDHSKLVGQIAALWGNENFESPRPFVSMTRAAT